MEKYGCLNGLEAYAYIRCALFDINYDIVLSVIITFLFLYRELHIKYLNLISSPVLNLLPVPMKLVAFIILIWQSVFVYWWC